MLGRNSYQNAAVVVSLIIIEQAQRITAMQGRTLLLSLLTLGLVKEES